MDGPCAEACARLQRESGVEGLRGGSDDGPPLAARGTGSEHRLKIEVQKSTVERSLSHTHSRAHTHTYLHTHALLRSLLLRLAEVVAEVEVAGWLGDERGALRDGHVLQVQEAELDFHGEEDLQLAVHGLAAHLPSQQDIQSVRPQAELTEGNAG